MINLYIKFNIFYGELKTAPLIEQCPVNLECAVAHIIDLGSHDLVIGEIKETHVSENCLTDGKPDVQKIKPFHYVMDKGTFSYFDLGKFIGKAFQIGKELKKE